MYVALAVGFGVPLMHPLKAEIESIFQHKSSMDERIEDG